eukprot:PhF_6_TR19073/c0_g1_i3/m.28045
MSTVENLKSALTYLQKAQEILGKTDIPPVQGEEGEEEEKQNIFAQIHNTVSLLNRCVKNTDHPSSALPSPNNNKVVTLRKFGHGGASSSPIDLCSSVKKVIETLYCGCEQLAAEDDITAFLDMCQKECRNPITVLYGRCMVSQSTGQMWVDVRNIRLIGARLVGSHWEYEIHSVGTEAPVFRRYKDFERLRNLLTKIFPGRIVPPLPSKDQKKGVSIGGKESVSLNQIESLTMNNLVHLYANNPTVVERMFLLEQFLRALGYTEIVEHNVVRLFLTGKDFTCEESSWTESVSPTVTFKLHKTIHHSVTDVLSHLVGVQSHSVRLSLQYQALGSKIMNYFEKEVVWSPSVPATLPTEDSDPNAFWDAVRPIVENEFKTSPHVLFNLLAASMTFLFWSQILSVSIPEAFSHLFALSQAAPQGTNVTTSARSANAVGNLNHHEIGSAYELIVLEIERWFRQRQVEVGNSVHLYVQAMK